MRETPPKSNTAAVFPSPETASPPPVGESLNVFTSCPVPRSQTCSDGLEVSSDFPSAEIAMPLAYLVAMRNRGATAGGGGSYPAAGESAATALPQQTVSNAMINRYRMIC